MLQNIIIPIIFVLIIVLAVVLILRSQSKKHDAALLGAFGKPPENEDLDPSKISGYHQFCLRTNSSGLPLIDDMTWHDLNMDDVFRRVCACQTSVGQAFLYHRLHDINDDAELRRWIAFFNHNPETRIYIQKILSSIGQSKFSLAPYLSGQETGGLPFPVWIYRLLSAASAGILLLSVISGFFFTSALTFCILGFILLSLVNIWIYYKTKLLLENGLERLSYLGSVLYGCKKIMKIKSSQMPDDLDALNEALFSLRFIRGKLSKRRKALMAELAFLQEYLSMIFLMDIHRYCQSIKFITANTQAVKTVFMTIGRIDAAISVLSYRKSVAFFCEPEIVSDNILSFQSIYHPLLNAPISNSGSMTRNALITGVNASGKSTFIKSLAINNILGLSVHTCLAERYQLKRVYVISAMAVSDNILNGESYYIAEIKSLKRILDIINKQPCTCFIDEILRGTNAAERLAVTTALLHYLESTDSLCLFATHDTSLAESFCESYSNFHFEELVNETEVLFDYRLKAGIAAGRNAIRLLKLYQYPDTIVRDAASQIEKKWKDRPGPAPSD